MTGGNAIHCQRDRRNLSDAVVDFVVSLNLKRRHLNTSQRDMIAARLENMSHGGNRRGDQDANLHLVTRSEAARLMNVSERSVADAAAVQRTGTPELVAAVDAGQVSVSAAAEVATLPEDEQREVVARGEKEILEKAKAIRGGDRKSDDFKPQICGLISKAEAKQRQLAAQNNDAGRAVSPNMGEQGKATEHVSRQFGISRGSVEQGEVVYRDGTPEVVEVDRRRERGGDRRSEDVQSKAQPCAIEKHNNKKSAAETAAIVGTSARKVERVRTVLDKGTPEVVEAVNL